MHFWRLVEELKAQRNVQFPSAQKSLCVKHCCYQQHLPQPKSGIPSWKKCLLEAADLLPHRNGGTDNIVHSHAEITLSVPGQR